MKRFLAVAFLMLAIAAPAQAAPQDDANYISENIMSPFCPGVTLQACPSDSATALRERITGWAEDGMTRAQIMDRLVAEFGPNIRAQPSRSGNGLLAWVIPACVVVGAAGLAWTLLKRWAHAPDPSDHVVADVPLSATDKHRLDAELEKLRGLA